MKDSLRNKCKLDSASCKTFPFFTLMKSRNLFIGIKLNSKDYSLNKLNSYFHLVVTDYNSNGKYKHSPFIGQLYEHISHKLYLK